MNVLLALVLLAAPAFADEASELAMEADRLNQESCLDVAEQREVNKAGLAMAQVSVLWVKVDEVFTAAPEPKPNYLQYWRGVLGQCLDRNELALADLEAFAASEADNPGYADLVKDSKNRIVRLERAIAGVVDRPVQPFFILGLGGGYQRIEAPGVEKGGWHYGVAALDVSFRLKGPLALMGFARLGWSEETRDTTDEEADGDAELRTFSLQTAFGLGPMLRFAGPVYGFVGVLLQVAPNGQPTFDSPVLVGAALTGGLEIPFPDTPLGVRVYGEVGNLNDSITVRGMGGMILRMGE
jgi:hypothetical protein